MGERKCSRVIFKMKMIKRVENVSMRNKELLIKRKNDSIRENHTAVAELWIGSATNLISGTFSFASTLPTGVFLISQ